MKIDKPAAIPSTSGGKRKRLDSSLSSDTDNQATKISKVADEPGTGQRPTRFTKLTIPQSSTLPEQSQPQTK